MKEPVLEHGSIRILQSKTARHVKRIDDATKPNQTHHRCGTLNVMPWCAQGSRKKQYDAEMNDSGCRKSRACLLLLLTGRVSGYIGEERNNNELKADQSSGRRSEDYEEIAPSGECCNFIHVLISSLPEKIPQFRELGHALRSKLASGVLGSVT